MIYVYTPTITPWEHREHIVRKEYFRRVYMNSVCTVLHVLSSLG